MLGVSALSIFSSSIKLLISTASFDTGRTLSVSSNAAPARFTADLTLHELEVGLGHLTEGCDKVTPRPQGYHEEHLRLKSYPGN